jgi:ankyrin repeat protein
MADSFDQLVLAVKAGKIDDVRQALERHPEVRERLDEPHPDLPFDSTVLLSAVRQKNKEMIDVLLNAGADINVRSGWWAGGFGALDGADPGLVPFLLERGAVVDAHAAARLGMIDELDRLLTATPELVHARGGDGQTPLHFAANIDVARLLLALGADIDAIDVDHEGTPAQYMVRDRQDVARYLVSRGARTDILLTAALGDLERTRAHLDRDPASVGISVSDRHFPKKNPRSGGIIYIWTLGSHKTPHAVAREFGHDDVYRLLVERSPAPLKLAAACQVGDDGAIEALLAATPKLASMLEADEREKLAQAAHNHETEVVRRMLAAGWPTDDRGPHGGTALHWASWHGNARMVQEILKYHPAIEIRDREHNGTPLEWALHGSLNSWHCRTGDYGGALEALLAAGARAPELTPDLQVSQQAREALERHAHKG